MRTTRQYRSPYAAMLWSVVLPGFGQFYNRDYIMGFTLLILEFVINVKAKLNLALIFSFDGNLPGSKPPIDYSWGLFYPSLYGFAIWHAYNTAKTNNQILEGNVENRTYLSGFFLGIVLGMDFGLFWHDGPILKNFSFFDAPVFNGIFFGLVMGLIGQLLENNVYRKNKRKKMRVT